MLVAVSPDHDRVRAYLRYVVHNYDASSVRDRTTMLRELSSLADRAAIELEALLDCDERPAQRQIVEG